MSMVKKMFLIDDDPITNFLNENIINELRMVQQLRIFTEAVKALEALKEECMNEKGPDLILLDLNMPYFNGFDFIEAFKELDVSKSSNVRIVILTSSQHIKDQQRLTELGVEHVLSKPLTKEKILSVI